jgi:predicted nucleic acid-binding protein
MTAAAIVFDASIAMAWCFLDEATPATRKLFEDMSSTTAVVPAWWYIELANVLYLAERGRRIPAIRVVEFIATVEDMRVEVDHEAPSRAFTHLLPLCRAHHLTSYDAIYLDLALRRKLPLATLDGPLRKAAKKLGVKVLGK